MNKAILEHKADEGSDGRGLLLRTTWRHYYGYRNRYDVARRHLGGKSAQMVALEYHILIFFSHIMCLSPKNRAHGRFNVRMIRDALRDAKEGRLGWNESYWNQDQTVADIGLRHFTELDKEALGCFSGAQGLELSEEKQKA